MDFRCNPSFYPVLKADPDVRYFHLRGGRGRGGSFFATDYALACLSEPDYFRCFIMRAVHGDIRLSLWRDLMDRMDEKEDRGELNKADFKINVSEMSVTHIPTGNTIQSRGFRKSAGTSTARLKSLAGASMIIIEEAEEIGPDDFNQLDDSLRKKDVHTKIFMVFNPPHKDHWIHTRWYTLRESKIKGYYVADAKPDKNFISVFSTYHNNYSNLPQSFIDKLESHYDRDKEYYYTVVRGLISEGVKGRIYRNWTAITLQEFKDLPYPSYYVLDWGFSNDPLALLEVKKHGRKRWARQLIYETDILNPELNRRLKDLRVGQRLIIADSEESKSIAEFQGWNYNMIRSRKGKDSISFGIRAMQALDWHYTNDSDGLIKEYQNYKWAFTPDKEQKDEPVQKWDHCMDALRYGEITPHEAADIEHY